MLPGLLCSRLLLKVMLMSLRDADVIASLPESIEVRVIDDNGGTTHLGYMDTRTGEITQEDRWFDMKGRRLLHKPTVKGIYYNNGNKVILK